MANKQFVLALAAAAGLLWWLNRRQASSGPAAPPAPPAPPKPSWE